MERNGTFRVCSVPHFSKALKHGYVNLVDWSPRMERWNGALEWTTVYWNGALECAVLLFLATNEYHFSSCSLLSGIFELYINFRVYICDLSSEKGPYAPRTRFLLYCLI